MKPLVEGTKEALAMALLFIIVAISLSLWFLDPFSMQRVYGALMATDLIAFAMLVYIIYKPELSEVSNTWLLVGCAAVATCVFVALAVAV